MQEDVLDAEDAAVARKRNLGVMDLAALLGGGEKMLEPVLDPFDRRLSRIAIQGSATSSG